MTRSIVAATLLLTAALAGCDSGSKAPEPEPKKDTPAKSEAPGTGNTGKLGEVATPAKSAIATANGEATGVRIEITELARTSGEMVTLKFSIVNDSKDKWDVSTTMQTGSSTHRAVDGITLVDPVGKKRYFVVVDTDGKPLCSTGVQETEAASRTNLWAKFPAPPADVKKVSVVFPHFDPLDDVPLS